MKWFEPIHAVCGWKSILNIAPTRHGKHLPLETQGLRKLTASSRSHLLSPRVPARILLKTDQISQALDWSAPDAWRKHRSCEPNAKCQRSTRSLELAIVVNMLRSRSWGWNYIFLLPQRRRDGEIGYTGRIYFKPDPKLQLRGRKKSHNSPRLPNHVRRRISCEFAACVKPFLSQNVRSHKR